MPALPPLPTYDEGWECISWLTFFLFFALIGQRAPDDRLWARDPLHGAPLRRPRGVPRALRPGVFAAVAVLLGAASFVVARRGGWEAQASALALAVTLALADALAVWLYQCFLWLRVAALLRTGVFALALATLIMFARVSSVGAWLVVPSLVWTLYLLADAIFVWAWNRTTVSNEIDSIVVELQSTHDPLAATPLPARD